MAEQPVVGFLKTYDPISTLRFSDGIWARFSSLLGSSTRVKQKYKRFESCLYICIPHSKPAFIHSLHSLSAMRSALCLVALASVVSSQLINLDAIALDFDPPELVKAPINVESDTPAVSDSDAITPLQSTSEKRDLVDKRDGDCSPYKAGSGPVPTPDTTDAFLSDPDFAVCPFHQELQIFIELRF